ncbi:Hypothetical protein R9X50_00439200 [Acrodontium crateriforme]|uniref:Uncharacterized protein n=1 Tax=Acrodontium crateriforme TaxID=150365 RepID=A0AAQ3RAS2_9PEZI|nr:Hypothetical protein R9X50_00439200 [Acrodontium crateriforme]
MDNENWHVSGTFDDLFGSDADPIWSTPFGASPSSYSIQSVRRWLYPPRYPVFWLGNYEIPAVVVPLIISASFLLYRVYWRKALVRSLNVARSDKIETDKEVTREKGASDEENLAENDEQPNSGVIQLLRFLLQIYSFNHLRLFGEFTNHSLPPPTWTCIAEIVTLLVAGTVFMKRTMLPTYAALSLSWLILFVHLYTNAKLAIAVGIMMIILAMPTICNSPEDFDRTSHGPFFSSCLLMGLVLQNLIPPSHPIRGLYLSDQPRELWPIALLLIQISIGSFAYRMRTSSIGLGSAFLAEGHATAYRLLRIGFIVVIFISLELIADFSASCMGFRWLLLHERSTPPGIGAGGVLAGGIMFALSVMLRVPEHVRDPKGNEIEDENTYESVLKYVEHLSNAMGWTIIGLLSIALTLRGVKDLSGDRDLLDLVTCIRCWFDSVWTRECFGIAVQAPSSRLLDAPYPPYSFLSYIRRAYGHNTPSMALPSSPPVLPEPDLPSSPPSLCLSQQPSLGFGGPSRKRQFSDYGSFSSDPWFSDTTSDADLRDDSEQPKRKKVVQGPWWSLGRKAGQNLRRNMAKESFRNTDSGVWMGSDEHEASSDDIASSQNKSEIMAMSDASDGEATPMPKKVINAGDIVGRIINNCLDEGLQTVDLSGLGLTSISNEAIRPLHQLIRQTHIDLTQPPSEDEFTPLTPSIQLFLARNFIEVLPPELFTLKTITVLSLRGNRLEKLPAAISHLHDLKELNIAGNSIQHLPWELLNMMNCRDTHRTISLRPNPFIRPTDLAGSWTHPDKEDSDLNNISSDETTLRQIYEKSGALNSMRGHLELGLRIGRARLQHHQEVFGNIVNADATCRDQLIYLGSSTVQYFSIDGLPMGRSNPEDHFAAVLNPTINMPITAMSASAPSLFELALRSLQSTYDLQDAVLSVAEQVSPTVLAALRKAGRNAGEYGSNETCSTCRKMFVIPRAEWMEYWFNGLPSQEGLTQETVLPFLRKACSWACARPSQVGEFRA